MTNSETRTNTDKCEGSIVEKVPDFELAPLQEFPVELFLSDNCAPKDLREFVLGLALAFNDAKGYEWWIVQLMKGPPTDTQVPSPYFGQHSGMTVQILRTYFAMFHEVCEMINKYATAISSPEFQEIKGQLSVGALSRWEVLRDFALEGRTRRLENKTVAALFQTLRSNGAHHYQAAGIMKGYELSVKQGDVFSGKAFASIGRNFEETRFYFADMAADGVLKHFFNGLSTDMKFFKEMRELLNLPLKEIVEIYLKSTSVSKPKA